MDHLGLSIFKKIRRIQLEAVHQVEDLFAGAYRSAFKGRGMEFEDVREYQSGDEIRAIDWNVTARMNHPYVKNFREERELTLTLLVDVSASTSFGSGQQLKSELMAEIAALLAFSAIKNHDKVSLILFSDHVEKYLPPGHGTRHVLRVIRELLTHRSKAKATKIGSALEFLGKVQSRASICFLITDGMSANYIQEAKIIARQHDFILLLVIDPCEKKFPFTNALTPCVDLETGQRVLIGSKKSDVNRCLSNDMQLRIEDHRRSIQRLGGDFLVLETNQPYLSQMHQFFLSRRHQR